MKADEKIEKELEDCRKELMKERAKSEVIVEFYKHTIHSQQGVHVCQHLKKDEADYSKTKEHQQLKDKIERLEKEMLDMELSHIRRLNNEMKESIDRSVSINSNTFINNSFNLDDFQNVLHQMEQNLHKSQREVSECHKRYTVTFFLVFY